MKGEVWSVKCGVENVEWRVWSVGVWSVKCKV